MRSDGHRTCRSKNPSNDNYSISVELELKKKKMKKTPTWQTNC